jgi:RNA polymerase sigma factor (sigma-70 family)
MSRLEASFVLMSVLASRLDSLTDEQLLRRTVQDAEAFGVFYRRHVERVLRFFTARTDEPEHAADLMAETFAAAFTAAGRFRPGPEPPVAWLFVIAQRKLADARRRGRVAHRARARLALDPLVLDDADLARIEELASSAGIEELLRGLSQLERDAVVAHVVDERPYAEIAAEMRCSPLVVRQRVSRGLRRMRGRVARGTS